MPAVVAARATPTTAMTVRGDRATVVISEVRCTLLPPWLWPGRAGIRFQWIMTGVPSGTCEVMIRSASGGTRTQPSLLASP